MALTFFIFSWLASLLTLGLFARFITAVFSEKSCQRIKYHPKWHLIWTLIVIVFWIVIFEIPVIEDQISIKGQLVKLRERVQTCVNQTGGWNVLRAEVKALSDKTNPRNQNPFYWKIEKKDNSELTNFFPTIAELNPWEIRYLKNSTNDGYAVVQVFFKQWGGGRGCTRYYSLVLTPTNYDGFPPSFIESGDKVRKLTNSIYEVTWHF